MWGRFFIARHGETVFNAAGRVQGEEVHTPLTRAGFAQAEQMGRALREHVGSTPPLTLWASPTGRALQTLAVIAEHLDLDWHEARADARLGEIRMGAWSGRWYRDIVAEGGLVFDSDTGLFSRRPPGGERYDEIAQRVRSWLDNSREEPEDQLIVTHGMTSRVLRGILTGAADHPQCGAPVAVGLPQGSVVLVEDGVESLVHLGTGGGGA